VEVELFDGGVLVVIGGLITQAGRFAVSKVLAKQKIKEGETAEAIARVELEKTKTQTEGDIMKMSTEAAALFLNRIETLEKGVDGLRESVQKCEEERLSDRQEFAKLQRESDETCTRNTNILRKDLRRIAKLLRRSTSLTANGLQELDEVERRSLRMDDQADGE
jgi:hypothetical protein